MAISVSKLTITVNGVDYTGTVSTGAVSIAVPYADKGAAVTVKSVVASGSAASAPTYTPSVASAVTAPASGVTVTVTDNATPTAATATVTLTVTLAEGEGEPGMVTYPGWFKFRKLPMNVKYVTDGITLDGVKEVLGVQSGKVVAFEFDEREWTYNVRQAKYAPLNGSLPLAGRHRAPSPTHPRGLSSRRTPR